MMCVIEDKKKRDFDGIYVNQELRTGAHSFSLKK